MRLNGVVSATPPILEIRGLRKSFHHVEVLRGIDLSVAPQELVFIIGPSGSGKSTLLRCCNRLEEPTGGSIRVDGVDIMARSTDINAMRRRIGMVFQSFNLYPHMTALGNVALALVKVLRRPRKEAERVALAALDPELVGSVLNVMRELKHGGMTMLVVSHEMRFARDAADRVIFLDHGAIVEEGPPEQIFSQPERTRTRAFIADIAR